MKKIVNFFAYAFVIIMAFVTLFPFVYMIIASLMTFQESISIPPKFFPAVIQWSNYVEVLQKAPFARYFFNTTLVSIVTTAGVLVTTVLAAFALVMLEFKHKNLVVFGLISLLMIPFEAIVFTNFQTIARLGLLDTYAALILPFFASVFYMYYLKQYMETIPNSYYRAAKIDGCGDLEFIWKVLLPIMRPALVTVGLLCFISSWNAFLWPLLVTNTPAMRLLNNGLSAFATEAGSQVQLQMAASTITIVPVMILYFAFRKQIISGVSKNGIKG
ncbi:sugar ABC transporter permease [Erysipelothrix larvae]|uniref:Sugar ABC transporter permease n=1 Tax=Erysipelothrix larvae TaxID=1514105 RepID=A0A0X8H1Q3_9FIRM|nr:carbohydrate ABC transporter permease [Erysipelothrix larvae]AMC94451.1 sugar ABC transporter permease [Erysipelothrix larvae]